MAKLEEILQQEVNAEISGIVALAEEKAKGLLQEAQAKAEALKAAKLKSLEGEHAAAIKRAESAAELLQSQSKVQARGLVVTQVKTELRKALEALQQSPSYASVLQKLAAEALAGIGKAEALVVNPADAAHLEAWAKAQGLELKHDPSLSLGVRLVGVGGKAQVQNSLIERLERGWDALSAKAAKAIWG